MGEKEISGARGGVSCGGSWRGKTSVASIMKDRENSDHVTCSRLVCCSVLMLAESSFATL